MLQIVQRRCTNQSVAHIRTRQHGGNVKNVPAYGLDIFHRMHRDIDLVIQQRTFELFGPKRLAADFGKRPVLNLVAGGEHRDQNDGIVGQIMRRFDGSHGHLRLRQSERRPACSDA